MGLIGAELATVNPLADQTADEMAAGDTAGDIPWLTLLALAYIATVMALLLWRGRRHLDRAIHREFAALPAQHFIAQARAPVGT